MSFVTLESFVNLEVLCNFLERIRTPKVWTKLKLKNIQANGKIPLWTIGMHLLGFVSRFFKFSLKFQENFFRFLANKMLQNRLKQFCWFSRFFVKKFHRRQETEINNLDVLWKLDTLLFINDLYINLILSNKNIRFLFTAKRNFISFDVHIKGS